MAATVGPRLVGSGGIENAAQQTGVLLVEESFTHHNHYMRMSIGGIEYGRTNAESRK